MRTKFSFSLLAFLMFSFLVVGYVVFAFQAPTVAPPGNNVAPPLNVGSIPQLKSAGLGLNIDGTFANGLFVYGNVGVETSVPGALFNVAGDKTDPVSGSCLAGYDWYDENGDSIKDSGECKRTSLFVRSDGNVGIGTQNPQYTLHVEGQGYFSGGLGPPYVSFSNESHENIRRYAKNTIADDKVMYFWNGAARRMELYVIDEDRFYTMTGELIEE